jgi:hypothetical protein
MFAYRCYYAGSGPSRIALVGRSRGGRYRPKVAIQQVFALSLKRPLTSRPAPPAGGTDKRHPCYSVAFGLFKIASGMFSRDASVLVSSRVRIRHAR